MLVPVLTLVRVDRQLHVDDSADESLRDLREELFLLEVRDGVEERLLETVALHVPEEDRSRLLGEVLTAEHDALASERSADGASQRHDGVAVLDGAGDDLQTMIPRGEYNELVLLERLVEICD